MEKLRQLKKKFLEKFDIFVIRYSRQSWIRTAKRSPLQHFIVQELFNRMQTRPMTLQ